MSTDLLFGYNVASVPNLRALREYPTYDLTAASQIGVGGKDLLGDFGGGLFQWVPSSTQADDNTVIIAPYAGGFGRWIKTGAGAVNVANSLGDSPVIAPSQAAVKPLKDKLDSFISAKDFGAKGDGTTDDTKAIQAALDFVGNSGGGVVFLPKTSGRYRITDTIRIPAYTVLQGNVPQGYVFNSGNLNSSSLVADFVDPMKWVVEANTKKSSNGQYYAYDEIVSGSLDSCIPSYNCGVKDLAIVTKDNIPYGGLRLHGAPGSIIDQVCVNGTGIGVLVNFSFDLRVRVHTLSQYYGFIGWDDVNASSFNIYTGQTYNRPLTVPDAYRPKFISALDNTLVGARAMATDTHTKRPFGMVFGSTSSLSVSNDFYFCSERFEGGIFMLNAKGAAFTRLYLEGDVGQMGYGLAITNSEFNIESLHAFMSNSGVLFDLGAGIDGSVRPGGIINPVRFGTGPFGGDGSQLIIHNVAPSPESALAPAQPSSTLYHVDLPGAWINVTSFMNGWSSAPGGAPAGYRLNRGKLEFRGGVTGGTYGASAFILPLGYRPSFGLGLATPLRGTMGIQTNGNVIPYPEGAAIGLDGITTPLY